MPLSRDENGIWTADQSDTEKAGVNPVLAEALPRYLTILDELFEKARQTNEQQMPIFDDIDAYEYKGLL